MKKIAITTFLLIFAATLPIAALAQKNKKDKKDKTETTAKMPELKTLDDSISYLIGFDLARNLKDKVNLNIELFTKAIQEATSGKESMLSEEQMQHAYMSLNERISQAQDSEAKASSKENKDKGEAFLAKNKSEDGVKVTASGLQYKVLTEGSGVSPTAESTVKVHYTGTLIDGTKFDSSVDRGEPIEFPLNGVIKGWTEGLQLMKPGAKYMFYIPSDLGYGDRDMGPIPGGSVLIFEVELLEVK